MNEEPKRPAHPAIQAMHRSEKQRPKKPDGVKRLYETASHANDDT
jgi:hypothetical protein